LCRVSGSISDLTYVISVPENSVFASGYTFMVRDVDLRASPSPIGPNCSLAAPCVRLPGLGEVAGTYAVDLSTASADQGVGFDVGSGTSYRSIPVVATLRPAWLFDGSLACDSNRDFCEASILGMTLQPFSALPLVGGGLPYPGPSAGSDTPPSLGFDTLVPDGPYELTLAPIPPFDRAFPPSVRVLKVKNQGMPPTDKRTEADYLEWSTRFKGGESQAVPHAVDVSRAATEPFGDPRTLEGWTLYLRDDRTKRRISSLAALHEPATIKLFTTGQEDETGKPNTIRKHVELVLAPPADGPKLPELVHAALGDVPATANYPQLPPLVTVGGHVVGEDGVPVHAHIVVEAITLDVLDPDSDAKDLQFVDSFETTLDGDYERKLPSGRYTAIMTPILSPQPGDVADPAGRSAKTILELPVGFPQSDHDVQAGRKHTLANAVNLAGRCVTTDGRPLAEAEVEAHAAAALRYGTKEEADPLRWPRTVVTRTAPNGQFKMPAEPGAKYDVVVRPAQGTRFPWVVRTGVTAPAEDLTIDVPAPLAIVVRLLDPSGNPAAQALVSAYRGLESQTDPKVAVEIGRVRTDAAGRLELYLDSRPR
jgi:hypothetical protein